MDAVVTPYHWSNRTKLEKDFTYLTELFERLLPSVSAFLNLHHGVTHSHRYWRILIGPWLAYFSQSLFDKWESVHSAAKLFPACESITLNLKNSDLVPISMGELFSNYLFNDYWNHHIFTEIIKRSTHIVTSDGGTPRAALHASFTDKPIKRSIRSKLRSAYNWLTKGIAKRDDYFIISSYLSVTNDVLLQCRLHQLPKLWSSPVQAWERREIDRDGFELEFEATNDYEITLKALLPLQMPQVYLERFARLNELKDSQGWPKSPKAIFTSNALWHDDIAMAYVADMVDRGAKLVHGQHGGFGLQAYAWAEYHERQIADRYLTWGWTEEGAPNLTPVGLLKSVSKYTVNRSANKDGARQRLLLVRALSAPYAFRVDSDIGVPQLLRNIERCLCFAENLPRPLRDDNLLVRLYPLARAFSSSGDSAIEPTENFYNERSVWRERFPTVEVNDGYDDIAEYVRQSRLIVYSYNGGTGYLEFIAADIPVIMFWDMRNSPVRESAVPYFEALRAANLFHDSPESAAGHVARVWSDIPAWWNSKEVRLALRQFSTQYCKVNNALVADISEELKQLSNH